MNMLTAPVSSTDQLFSSLNIERVSEDDRSGIIYDFTMDGSLTPNEALYGTIYTEEDGSTINFDGPLLTAYKHGIRIHFKNWDAISFHEFFSILCELSMSFMIDPRDQSLISKHANFSFAVIDD